MLELIRPKIFSDYPVISGVTTKNLTEFPPFGLSLSNAKILNDEMLEQHKSKFADLLGVNPQYMKYQQQTHSDIIREIDLNSSYENSDGMYTSQIGLVLNIKIADCTAVLIYDPRHNIVMGLHSGWRGTMQNIAGKGIEILRNKYDSNPSELLVYISPAASMQNYEVGEDVAKYFPRSVSPIANSNKFLYNNHREIGLQLLDAGLIYANIEVSAECTIENTNLHSYRRDKEKSGRMSAFIGLKSE